MPFDEDDWLTCPVNSMAAKQKCAITQAIEIKQSLAKFVGNKKMGCYSRLTTGHNGLDSFLDGGIPLGITELYGEAGSGKTFLTLLLCLSVQLPIECGGLNGSMIVC